MSIVRLGLKRGKSPLYCKAVVHGGIAYLAGQVAVDPLPSAGEQAQQIFAQIDRYLAECGTDKSKLLKATVFFADFRDYNEVNAVWDAWVDPNAVPIRSAFEAKLVTSKHLVAVEVMAAI